MSKMLLFKRSETDSRLLIQNKLISRSYSETKCELEKENDKLSAAIMTDAIQ